MAESSMFWTTDGTGDGTAGGYTMAQWLRVFRCTLMRDMTTQGPAQGYLSELEPTNPAGRDLQVDTGGALVAGFAYWNTSAVTKTLTAPVVGTTGWRLVLRADWTAQTVRIVLLEAADGTATPPAVTQSDEVTYEISLAYGTITTGEVVTLTDDRTFLSPNLSIITANLADKAVTYAKVQDMAARSVLGRSGASSGVPAAITAGTDHYVLRRSGTSIAFGIVDNEGLGANCKRVVGELMENAAATLGGSDSRRMVVGGVTYESWVHCDGGASVNGVTIPDLRDRVLAGASATNAAGSTAGADQRDLSHTHGVGSYAVSSHTHGVGTLAVASHRHSVSITSQMSSDILGCATGSATASANSHTHLVSGDTGYFQPGLSGNTAAATPTLSGSSASGGSATQDMRQATYYVRRFIYVG